ncbi:helix-turn-helix transcriptional regulator [Amycolatopsis dendrobii]|uniref:Helix-turn-helix transcriptional regulator n=1 Tax=Amycolatopsis dendrobii TaxID=2760662 RepID=A0A7W3W3K2_9PSEU|nr:helix-turn-helix transcriptional regulator [Amycolatopsis dendrobii]MBB1158089.1 helix-turn-helix transcriptional regulator [Amycolatopsis dendrobii]
MSKRREALILAREDAGHTQETLAAVLGVDRTTVARWESGGHRPLPHQWPELGRVLGRPVADVRAFFGEGSSEADGSALTSAFAWLDRSAGWAAGTARRAARPKSGREDLSGRRSTEAEVLQRYYGTLHGEHCCFAAEVDGEVVATSVLTRQGWTDLRCSLDVAGDALMLDVHAAAAVRRAVPDVAVSRLAEAAKAGVRIADRPLYRLLDVDVRAGQVGGTVGTTSFTEYALGPDLLERELTVGETRLRSELLPDLPSVLDVRNRLCAGGVLALTAIARSADPARGEADYLLLVQERSGHVVNGSGRLAVIPKGFHGPLADQRGDARIGATLRRELEEELFGRDDVDTTTEVQRAADPMHPARLSEPMRWLMAEPDRMRMECTGFGFNLVSGNYEFAALVVIEDEEFWPRFGGVVEANWEVSGLRQYSSLDRELVGELITDEKWTNEGLFAFLLGLRRLSEIGGARVSLPPIDLRC